MVSGTILLIIETVLKKSFRKIKIFNGFFRSIESFINQGFYLLNFQRKKKFFFLIFKIMQYYQSISEGAALLVNLSFRIAVLSIRCAAFWVLRSYSAQILSCILNFNVKPPFSSSEEFVKDGTFKLINKNTTTLWAIVSTCTKHVEWNNPLIYNF